MTALFKCFGLNPTNSEGAEGEHLSRGESVNRGVEWGVLYPQCYDSSKL